MSISTCLTNAETSGEISRPEREAMQTLYDGLLQHYGDPTKAKAEMVNRLMAQAAHAKRQGLLAEEVRGKLEQFVLNFRNMRGEPDPAQALVYLIEHNGNTTMPAGMSSVQGRYKALAGAAQARMEEMLHETRRTWVTGQTRNTALLENVIREARGEATGDAAAKDMARVWTETADWLRQLFNDAGGAIPELKNWGMGQSHNRTALIRAGEPQWTKDIAAMLAPEKMKHPLTGEPMTAADLKESLSYIYKSITTDGWNEREASASRRGLGQISNQRAEARFLVFKSADDFISYNRDYGGGDLLSGMMEHIRGMAEDVAAMQVLGPNPDASLLYLQNFVTKQAALKRAGLPAVFPERTAVLGLEVGKQGLWTRDPEAYAVSMIRRSKDMWDVFRGNMGATSSPTTSMVFDTARNLNTAAKLGAASISALFGDAHTDFMARSFAGIAKDKLLWGEMFQAMGTMTKREAVAAGLILDTRLHMMQEHARWAGAMQGKEWSQVLADRTVAWTALQAITQGRKHSFGLAWMSTYAEHAERSFDRLPELLQRNFQRYGMGAAEWDAIRAVHAGDAPFLKPTDVMAAHRGGKLEGQRIGERYLEMILMDTEYAVPEGTMQARALAYGGLRRGDILNELRRSAAQFKMFAITYSMLQVERIAYKTLEDGKLRGAGYAAALTVIGGLMGALAVQSKQIKDGKDPIDMTGPHAAKFWGAALAQGGALGIYGDFLFSETNRTGGSLAQTIAGPTADVAGSILALTVGNAVQGIKGEKTNAGRELAHFAQRNTPLASSAWYMRLAYQHAVIDQLQRALDPDAAKSFHAQEMRQRKEFGSGFWWRPGQSGPDRLPKYGH